MLGQPTAHVGQRAGELSDCIAYCTKLETRKPGTEPVILGKPRCLKQVKGERSDLNRAREIYPPPTPPSQLLSTAEDDGDELRRCALGPLKANVVNVVTKL